MCTVENDRRATAHPLAPPCRMLALRQRLCIRCAARSPPQQRQLHGGDAGASSELVLGGSYALAGADCCPPTASNATNALLVLLRRRISTTASTTMVSTTDNTATPIMAASLRTPRSLQVYTSASASAILAKNIPIAATNEGGGESGGWPGGASVLPLRTKSCQSQSARAHFAAK